MDTADPTSAAPVRRCPRTRTGDTPSSGSQFPPYYTPTPSVRTRNNYFPSSESPRAGRDADLVRRQLPVPAPA